MRPLPGFTWDSIKGRYFKEDISRERRLIMDDLKNKNVEEIIKDWLGNPCTTVKFPSIEIPTSSSSSSSSSLKEHHLSSTDDSGLNIFLDGNYLFIRSFSIPSPLGLLPIQYGPTIMEHFFDGQPSRILDSFHPKDDLLFVNILYHSDKQESLCINLSKGSITILSDIIDCVKGDFIAYNSGKLSLSNDGFTKNINFSFRDISLLHGDNKVICAHRRSRLTVVDSLKGMIVSSITPLLDGSLPRRLITPFPNNIVYIETTNNDLISYDLRDPSIPSKLILVPHELRSGKELKYSFINYSFYGTFLGEKSLAIWDVRRISTVKEHYKFTHPIKDTIARGDELLIIK